MRRPNPAVPRAAHHPEAMPRPSPFPRPRPACHASPETGGIGINTPLARHGLASLRRSLQTQQRCEILSRM